MGRSCLRVRTWCTDRMAEPDGIWHFVSHGTFRADDDCTGAYPPGAGRPARHPKRRGNPCFNPGRRLRPASPVRLPSAARWRPRTRPWLGSRRSRSSSSSWPAPAAAADQIARLLQGLIEKKDLSPRPFIPINKPGGSGAEALRYLQDKAGDEHTVLVTLNSFYTTPDHPAGPRRRREQVHPDRPHGARHVPAVGAYRPR